MRIISHLFLLVMIMDNGQAQVYSHPNPSLVASYEKILNLQLEAGSQVLQILNNQERNHPFFYYLENLIDIIQLLLNENQANYRAALPNEKLRLEKLDAFSDDDPYKDFVISEIKLQWAFIKLKFGDSFSGGWNIRQAFRLTNDNIRRFPDFLPNKKSKAIIHILIGSVPSRYNWLLDLFGLSGNISQGIDLFEELSQDSSIFKLEAALLNCLTSAYIFEDSLALDKFKPVYGTHQKSLLAKLAFCMVNFKQHHSELALQILDSCLLFDNTYAKVHYLTYLKGKIHLQKGEYEKARSLFQQYISFYPGQNNKKDAFYQIFLSYWLNSERDLAKKAFETARESGRPVSSSDVYAHQILQNDTMPNQDMMKLRLATDGGYFEMASKIANKIENSNFSSQKEQVEFIYRKGRLAHLTGKYDAAIMAYQQTIDLAGASPWYFAPNAALQLGHIYTGKHDISKAKQLYHLVLTYKHHPYKQSLDQEAKSALLRIEKMP